MNEQNHKRSFFHGNNRRATARVDCFTSFQRFVFLVSEDGRADQNLIGFVPLV